MICQFEKLPSNYFLYQGCIFDKFFNTFRTGGPHLYRTKFLKELITAIPKDGESLGPESDSFFHLINKGFHYYCDNRFYGLHDFEQSNFDIYRKFFLFSKKFETDIPILLNKFKKKVLIDHDYRIALKGLSDGLLFEDKLLIDIDFFKHKYDSLSELNINEKKTLNKAIFKEAFTNINYNKLKYLPIRDSRKKIKKQSLFIRLIKRIFLKIYIKLETYLY